MTLTTTTLTALVVVVIRRIILLEAKYITLKLHKKLIHTYMTPLNLKKIQEVLQM